MSTHKHKPHDEPEAELVVAAELEPEAAPPANVNLALAELAGVPVTSRDTPVGLYCKRVDGRPWCPETDWNDAMLVAGRLDVKRLDVHVADGPAGLCKQLLKKGK